VGWLGSEPRVVGGIGSGVRVSASFQIFAIRMLLHSAGVTYKSSLFTNNGRGRFLWG